MSNWSHTGGFVTAFALSAVWLPRMEGAVRVPRPVWVAAMAVCLGVLFFSFLVLPLNFYGKCAGRRHREENAKKKFKPSQIIVSLNPPLRNPLLVWRQVADAFRWAAEAVHADVRRLLLPVPLPQQVRNNHMNGLALPSSCCLLF